MISVILCAAGSGSRSKLSENKILHDLLGMPVLCYSLSAFAPFADEILISCRKEDEAQILPLLNPYLNVRTVVGGRTRFESVFNALKETKGEIVLVHDAARPFVPSKLISECLESVKKNGSGVCALSCVDTVVLEKDGRAETVLKRNSIRTLQTPQGFRTEKLRKAYELALGDGKEYTDDSSVYSAYIEPAFLIPGDAANRKLTFPEDFQLAERVGFGVDTHAFDHLDEMERGISRLNLNYITLGGVVIPSNLPILAHSDGDVVVHALIDALLSAAGLRDIGFYFPDTDPYYKGMNSMELLKKTLQRLSEKGFSVLNASVSILAEKPKLSPYIEAMRNTLRRALSCENVAIAAGTNEKLGYIGQGRGITAYAMVLLR